MSNSVRLPKRRVVPTPMPLKTDAYTVGSSTFQSDMAKEKSVYYGVHRKSPQTFLPGIANDDRIVVVGLQRAIERTLYDALTQGELESAIDSLKTFKATSEGLKPYDFPRELWETVVKDYNGRPPICINAVPEGSVVYPHEPFVQVSCEVPGMGELAAWFECRILNTYSMTERTTRNEHFLLRIKEKIKAVDPYMSDDMVDFYSRNMLIDFSDRASVNEHESEDLGLAHLYTFPGTDNLPGHYQAYVASNEVGQGCSILALAHRNVQAHETEEACFKALYSSMNDGDLASYVADCNDYYEAVTNHLIPLIRESKLSGNRKKVVIRPDSGDVIEQLLWTLSKLREHGLVNTKIIDGKMWEYTPYSGIILADGLDFYAMMNIMEVLTSEGYLFWECVVFGSGGGLRNPLKRDNLSSKYALCSKGEIDIPVTKFSEDLGKATLPGPFKVLRDENSIDKGVTIVGSIEEGDSILIPYFDGRDIWDPFKEGMEDDYPTIKTRIETQMSSMPIKIGSGSVPASDYLKSIRLKLMEIHAPGKFKAAKS
jgi:nicotinamide phosphoribosyltransferase